MSIEKLDNLVKETIGAGKPWEGSADSAELEYLANLAKLPQIHNIGEIGFNAGLSSYTFLEANMNTRRVYSFDLGEYDYIKPAKEYIDHQFPKRHILVIGDSLATVPQFYASHPTLKFDLIFIDGGHDYNIAKADLTNMKNFATKDTILVTDDLVPWKPWGAGPTQAWQEVIAEGLVIQEELLRDGKIVNDIKPPGERSWAKGKYLL